MFTWVGLWSIPSFASYFCKTKYATTVKALIDAGTCSSVTTTSTICGDASISSSFYETFTYNNYRVVIMSGVPNHLAEYNQTRVNPNTRCKFSHKGCTGTLLLPNKPETSQAKKAQTMSQAWLLPHLTAVKLHFLDLHAVG